MNQEWIQYQLAIVNQTLPIYLESVLSHCKIYVSTVINDVIFITNNQKRNIIKRLTESFHKNYHIIHNESWVRTFVITDTWVMLKIISQIPETNYSLGKLFKLYKWVTSMNYFKIPNRIIQPKIHHVSTLSHFERIYIMSHIRIILPMRVVIYSHWTRRA